MRAGEEELLRQWGEGEVQAGDVRFLLRLCHHQRLGEAAIWETQRTLAELFGESYATIRNRVSRLRKLGWVRTLRNPCGLVLNPDLSTKGRACHVQQQAKLWEEAAPDTLEAPHPCS